MSLMHVKKRWGFVIFRTDYSSDTDWTKFMELYRICPQHVLKAYGPQRAALISSHEQMWWMDDRAKYENASLDTLYKHYHAWLESLDPGTRISNYPQNYMFLVVDAEVMERIRETDMESLAGLPLEQYPFVKVFDGEGLSSSDHDGYPGWMKLRLSGLYYLYEKGLQCWGMRELCAK
jgi:hypothetical protein